MSMGDTDGYFGNTMTGEEFRPIFDTTMKAGMNLWDTATAYSNGESEKILGGFVNDAGWENVIVSTKFTPQMAALYDKNHNLVQIREADEILKEAGYRVFAAGIIDYCKQNNMVFYGYMTLEQDAYARFKYDTTAEADGKIIRRVEEISEKRGVSMTEVSLAWLLTKVTAPVVGATKFSHVDGAVKAADLKLTEDEICYLEELYVPHALAGVMAQNGKQKAGNVV